MSSIIKVKVVKMSKDSWWYQHMIGKTLNVVPAAYSSEDYYCDGNGCDWDAGLLLKADCEIVATTQTLQEQLQQAKAAVDVIEKQLAAEAEKEALRPFTREEYERVVAEYRGCEGRLAVGLNNTKDAFCFSIYQGKLRTDWWGTCTLLPFGVAFKTERYVEKSIDKVGADKLMKAWEFEMAIGLPATA